MPAQLTSRGLFQSKCNNEIWICEKKFLYLESCEFEMHIRCDEKIPNNKKTRAWNNSNDMMLNELVSAWGPNDLHLSLYIFPILFYFVELKTIRSQRVFVRWIELL